MNQRTQLTHVDQLLLPLAIAVCLLAGVIFAAVAILALRALS